MQPLPLPWLSDIFVPPGCVTSTGDVQWPLEVPPPSGYGDLCSAPPIFLPFLPPAAATSLCPDMFSACRTSHRAAFPSPHLQKCPQTGGHRGPQCALCQSGDQWRGGIGHCAWMQWQHRAPRGDGTGQDPTWTHTVLWPWCPLCQPQLHPEPPLCCPIAHPLLLQGFLQQKGRKEGGRTPRKAHIFLQYEVDVTSTQKPVSQLERFQGLNAMGVSEPFKNTVHKRL